MQESYWSKLTQRSVSRRRALAGGVALGASAAFLAACGGGDGGGTSKPPEGSLLTPLKDRTKEAVQGGTLRHTTSNIQSLDVIGNGQTLVRITTSMPYNRLFKVMPGVNEASSGEKVGDAAESFEMAKDGLQLTVKLRQNLGSDPRPPLNGRVLDSADVLASWNRWVAKNALASDLLRSLNPDAPVESVQTPDRNTFVFKLAEPSTVLMDYLTDGFYFWVMPKEADGGFNPDSAAYGAGPYIVEDFLSGSHLRMSRNPNYYDKPLPYFDRQEWFIIPETAAQLAQFEAKTLDLGAGVQPETVVDVYNRHPGMVLYQTPITNVGLTARFGFAPNEPYHDVRVRRGISMMFDRGLMQEYFLNKSRLESQGLVVDAKWVSHISAMWGELSGDPGDAKSFGDSAQYFTYNLSEAKKLLAAAGHERLRIHYRTDSSSATGIRDADVVAGQLRDAGLQVDQEVADYASWFLPQVYRGRGQWSGITSGALGYKFSPEAFIYAYFHPGPGTGHYTKEVANANFPTLQSKMQAILREFDNNKREGLIKDFEKQAAADMPTLPVGSSAPTYTLAWPWVANAGVLVQWPGDGVAQRNVIYSRYWFDQKKAQELGKS